MTAPDQPPGPGRVVVLAGPSGSGKSRLADRLRRTHGWPIVRLDDFYREGDDPALPRSEELGMVDWDHPDSWDQDAAVAALRRLVETGNASMPLYDIASSRARGEHTVTARDDDLVLAEGIFAAEAVPALREADLLHSAWCIRHHRWHTFLLRLVRDLVERRKPAWTLVRRGLVLTREEPRVVARHVRLGAQPASPRRAEQALAGA
ncbi:ATP-binding protein [Janibacter cremeus]|uniref:Uridine kinase n=1 Tax=Janibacter cremeus TaxID=1285192 RepID=A0A852VSW4_9MICO|nr:uridine kinase [Janibacter cremeus]